MMRQLTRDIIFLVSVGAIIIVSGLIALPIHQYTVIHYGQIYYHNELGFEPLGLLGAIPLILVCIWYNRTFCWEDDFTSYG